MESRDIKDLHPILIEAYGFACGEFKCLYPDLPQPFLTCTYRSKEEQNRLYAQGRTSPGKRVTNAKGGQSPHNFNPSFAFDIAFKEGKRVDYSQHLFQIFWKIIEPKFPSVAWGGNFISIKDRPHFELKNWKELAKNT